MKRAAILLTVTATIAFVAFLGCNSGAIPGGGGTAGSLLVETGFTDAPASPGGTGGVGPPPVDGADDVELPAEQTRSFFTAFQIDPEAEDTAGPKFVVAGDVDQDGFLDLASAWNQSQPVQLHLQRRDPVGNISFRTISLGGTTPIAIVAGLEFGQINDDGFLDVVVLAKATGFATFCPKDPPQKISNHDGEIIVLFNPGDPNLITDGDRWTEMILVNPFVQDPWIHNQFPGNEFKTTEESKTKPEWSGFVSLAVANLDGRDGDDILVALNPGECEELGQKPPFNTVDLWVNPGAAQAENSALWGVPAPTGTALSRGVPVSLMADAPQVKDIAVLDVDEDGDLDVIATWTNSLSQNIRWARNPLVAHAAGGAAGFAEVVRGTTDGWRMFANGWQLRTVGQLDTGADVMAIGDIDDDGTSDLLLRSTVGEIIQWFRRPNALVVAPEFPPSDPVPDRFNFPWPVFTLTEFEEQEPAGIAVGDLTGDGVNEVVAAVQGGIYWLDGLVGDSAYDPWLPTTIIQDISGTSAPTGTAVPVVDPDATDPDADPTTPGSGVGVETFDITTHINALLIVDLDGDGKNDIIGTLDRRTGAGLSDDRLVWYRNTREDDGGAP